MSGASLVTMSVVGCCHTAGIYVSVQGALYGVTPTAFRTPGNYEHLEPGMELFRRGGISRQLGAALGIAVLGSLMNGTYADAVTGLPGVPAEATEVPRESLGGALAAAGQIGEPAGAALRDAATAGFLDGFGVAMLAGAGLLLAAALWIHRGLRARTADADEAAALEGELETV